MNDCSRIRLLLPLSAGGELGLRELRAVRNHLAGCRGCQEEEAEFQQLVVLARNMPKASYQLPEPLRRELGARAADRVLRRPWWRIAPFTFGPVSVSGRALVPAMVLLVALLAMPFLAQRGLGPAREDGVVKIQVVVQNGAVRLAWSDGKRDSYTVYKSSDPRSFSRGEARVVRSNVWTDTHPASSPIVFYRID